MDKEHLPQAVSGQRVVVMGGGLAGIAAACHLLDAGLSVTLVEKRPFLGGRAFSFVDAESGCEVDNGQHVFLGCCAYYIEFLKKLGCDSKVLLQRRLNLQVYDGHRAKGTLSSMTLPAPFNLLPSFLAYRHLSIADKARVLYAFAHMRLVNREKDPRLEQETFLSWLKRHHQSKKAIARFWDLITLPCLNDDAASVSASVGIMVFQEALLKTAAGGNIGYSSVGLSSLIGEAGAAYVRGHGGKLLLGSCVSRIHVDDRRVTGIQLSDGQTLVADAYISALPYEVLPTVLPSSLAETSYFQKGQALESAPIVAIHVWYDQPVADFDFAAFLDSDLQWVFNKSRILGLDSAQGQYLCISISGAWQFIDKPKAELARHFTDRLAQALPRARQAQVKRALVIKHPRATFRSTPGASLHRPSQETPLANLILAGDWTATGWPSTMESAVRSGVRAGELAAGRRAP